MKSGNKRDSPETGGPGPWRFFSYCGRRYCLNGAESPAAGGGFIIHQVHEFHGTQQDGEVLLIVKNQLLVHRIHPLHRQLHGPPAVHSAGGWVNGIKTLRRQRGRGEGGKLGSLVGGEVGHRGHLCKIAVSAVV